MLLTIAASLLAANAIYFVLLRKSNDPNAVAWVAYMPELEASQRIDRMNALRSSHSYDPRYPHLYLYEGGEALSLFAKIASDCRVPRYVISHYPGGDGIRTPSEMPDRFFMGSLAGEQALCVRKALPKGYQLAELDQPMNPAFVGWEAADLHIAQPQTE